ncbi:DUF4349 domain-containing protein [Dyadobacter sp. MSC1_007]|uniref:DUF4349 domain-containing protein n=1 Tax=Dyadobacter sp. MSC1_007 TaxID=2909264 RepID=UPI00202FC371|nr:DUF4349 domain-containing protein [Dyadobacter sp. MSC1_007]
MKKLAIIAIILTLAGCSARQNESAPAVEVDLTAMPPAPPQQTMEAIASPEPEPRSGSAADASAEKVAQKFIKTGRIEFETEDVDLTRETILASVKANGGYIGRDDEERSGSAISYTIVAHVPAARFETFLSSATKGVTDFRHKSISNEDVTAQYVDTESRLKTKKEIENRYRALLIKASTVQDILEIEEQLGEIRTDIEATEAQFKQLNRDVKYATLHIVFFRDIQTSSPFLTEIADALGEGADNIRAFVIVLAGIWPFVLLAIGLVIALSWFKKRREASRKAAPSLEIP